MYAANANIGVRRIGRAGHRSFVLLNHASRGRRMAAFVPAVLLLGLALSACDDAPSGGGGGRPPPKVVAMEIAPQRVVVREEFAGRAESVRSVEVRARIEGVLGERLYQEGAFVAQGQPLFRIDPRAFNVAVDKAQADLRRARSTLREAESNWERVDRLYKTGHVSGRTRDEALSALETARADVAAVQTELEQGNIRLGYTNIEAPIAGISGLETLSPGSLVQPGALLTTITQLDPINVQFALPADEAIARRYAESALAGRAPTELFPATLILPNGEAYAERGYVDFAESSVDPATGTVRARAVFSNPDKAIRPGQFVRLRLETATLAAALVVPEKAISLTQQGDIVFKIGPEGKVQATKIALGPLVDEGRVIESGLAAGDRIVVDGLVGLRDGAPVDAGPPAAAPAAAPGASG